MGFEFKGDSLKGDTVGDVQFAASEVDEVDGTVDNLILAEAVDRVVDNLKLTEAVDEAVGFRFAGPVDGMRPSESASPCRAVSSSPFFLLRISRRRLRRTLFFFSVLFLTVAADFAVHFLAFAPISCISSFDSCFEICPLWSLKKVVASSLWKHISPRVLGALLLVLLDVERALESFLIDDLANEVSLLVENRVHSVSTLLLSSLLLLLAT